MTDSSLPSAILGLVRHRRADDRIGRLELVGALRARGFFLDVSDETADRRMRAAIAVLRTTTEEGARIASTSDGSGYWYARSPEEIEVCAAGLASRISSINAAVRNMRREADRLKLQSQQLEQGRLI